MACSDQVRPSYVPSTFTRDVVYVMRSEIWEARIRMKNLGRTNMMTNKTSGAIALAVAISFVAMLPLTVHAGDKKVEGAAKGAAVGAAVGAVTGVGIGAAAVTGAVIGGATSKDSKGDKAEKTKSSGKPEKAKQ
jgi:hypothetical protein